VVSKEGYKVFSSYIREDLLLKMKLLSVSRGIPLYVLIDEALSRYFDEIDREGEFYEE